MTVKGLSPSETALLAKVFQKHPEIVSVVLFGSRAKGTHTKRSDVDLVVNGEITSLEAEAIASELDELPLPYRFEVQVFKLIKYRPLLDHIQRVGVAVYMREAEKDNAGGISYGW